MISPTCPYCKARFLYPDLKQRGKKRTGVCPHCGKPYRLSRLARVVYILGALAVLFGIDYALLFISDMNFPFLLVMTMLGVTAFYLLLPFSVRFRKAEPERPQEGKDKNPAKRKSGQNHGHLKK
jgi:CXXC-20-CXXC protein